MVGIAQADLEDFETDLGRFATWDSESGTLSAVQDGAAGNSGGGMILTNTASTAVGVEHYVVAPNTFYMVTAWIQVQAGGTSPFSFSMMLKSGQWDASDAVNNPGTWFTPGVWEFGANTTEETQWSETDNDWKIIGMSVFTGATDGILSVGFALGGSGAPAVYVDDVHVTRPNAVSVFDFDEDPYVAFDDTTNGFHYDGGQSPAVTLDGALPSTPANIRIYVPNWMGGGVGDGFTTSIRDVTNEYDVASWRMENTGESFDDGSPVIPLTTVSGAIYTANFWMMRDRSDPGNAWVNWNDEYETHLAWRLTDDPSPGDIEGWPGAIRPNAFHVICEGSSNSERNYAPDIYAPELTPGDRTTIDAVDPGGSRYSTMAFQAVDDTSWFEACIRGMRGTGTSSEGTSVWSMDDFRLFQHGDEGLVAAGVPQDVFEAYQ
jgi:hypothetical protein